jgi:hypothetical protein
LGLRYGGGVLTRVPLLTSTLGQGDKHHRSTRHTTDRPTPKVMLVLRTAHGGISAPDARDCRKARESRPAGQ